MAMKYGLSTSFHLPFFRCPLRSLEIIRYVLPFIAYRYANLKSFHMISLVIGIFSFGHIGIRTAYELNVDVDVSKVVGLIPTLLD